jgi:hypothetical protein
MNQTGLIAVVLSFVIVVAILFLPTTLTTQIDDAIKLASAVIGFVVAMVGAVKTVAGIAQTDIKTADLQAGGVVVGVGALLLLVSAIP